MGKNNTFFIMPTNEGQDLNYVETHTGTIVTAKIRGKEIACALQPILLQGQMGCKIENKDAEEVALFNAESGEWIKV
jgi:hypothetical protein